MVLINMPAPGYVTLQTIFDRFKPAAVAFRNNRKCFCHFPLSLFMRPGRSHAIPVLRQAPCNHQSALDLFQYSPSSNRISCRSRALPKRVP
jgi:hypothetical protein